MKRLVNLLVIAVIVMVNAVFICWTWFEFKVLRNLWLQLCCLAKPEMAMIYRTSLRREFDKNHRIVFDPVSAAPKPMYHAIRDSSEKVSKPIQRFYSV